MGLRTGHSGQSDFVWVIIRTYIPWGGMNPINPDAGPEVI
jgi:hypothetical protein